MADGATPADAPRAEATHADDEFTFQQLVEHSVHLFGYPSWAVEAALLYEGANYTQSVEKARAAIDRFMARVAA